MLLSLLTALVVAGIAYLTAFLFPALLPNMEVTDILKILLIGLPFFTLNKIFFSVLNGLSEMKKYSAFQLCRWLFILSFVLYACLSGQSLWVLMMAYPISEFMLFFIMLIAILPKIKHMKRGDRSFIAGHFRFGSRTVLAGTIGEVNNNVDVMLIGYFLGNSYAGLYSFAASITRGMAIIPGVIQMNFNPVISELYSQGETTRLSEYAKKVRDNSLLIMTVLLSISVIAYPVLIYYIIPAAGMQQSLPAFYILTAGVFAMTAYSYAGAFFTMAGYPGLQLRVAVLLFLYNGAMNVILIYLFGIYGAAIATASSYLFTLLLLRYLIKKKLGITI
jgi:O-antigen/teichoic acid export membrane protein